MGIDVRPKVFMFSDDPDCEGLRCRASAFAPMQEKRRIAAPAWYLIMVTSPFSYFWGNWHIPLKIKRNPAFEFYSICRFVGDV
jgi:hypothetical protein